jgi:hypothetical protein
MESMEREFIASPRLPGGDLVTALFNREVMTLADRGGASNLIGDRWADLAAAHAATWGGTARTTGGANGALLEIDRVQRLDAMPRVAAAASKRGLQNPDLLLIGERAGRPTIQAADAKFSVETARAKQVSPEVVQGLLVLRDQVPDLLDGLGSDPEIIPGVFLSPDYPLTHLMLRRRRGILRTTVRPEEVVLVPAPADHFWQAVAGAEVMEPLAAVDALPLSLESSLLAGVYYFRLARAAAGFWLDAHKPLLLHEDRVEVDLDAVRDEAARRARSAASAIELIRRWDSDTQRIRDQRAAVDQVAGFPIPSRDLREMSAAIARAHGQVPPSSNQVRRRLGAWYRGALRERVGPLRPPVNDLPRVLSQVANAGRDLQPQLNGEVERVVRELLTAPESQPAGSPATD